MRKIISIILTVIMILSSVSAFADGITSEELLSLIEKGTVLDIQNYLLTAGVEEIGVDISEFVENPDIQIAVISDIYGVRYETIQDLQDALNAAITNNIDPNSQGGGSSPSGGGSSSSGGGGGSSSGGGGGSSSSISRPAVAVSYKTYNFVGTVSLPNGEIAEEDIPVTISIQGTDTPETSEVMLLSASSGSSASGGSSGGGGSYGGGSTSVGTVVAVQNVNAVIPKGENSIKYATTWRIAESYSYAYAEAKVESDIYLQYSESDIILLDETTENALDIELNKPECYISGMFSLGESAEALPDDMNIQLCLSDADTEYYNYKYIYSITLPASEKEIDFSLPVMYGEYVLSYSAQANSINQQHVSTQVFTYEDVISADADVEGITLECQYGDVIEGVLKLPDGMVARDGGVDIKIRAGRTINVTIPEGQNSIHYTVADSEYIYFTQENAGIYDVHFKNINKNSITEDVSTITLEPIFTVSGKITFNEPVEDDETIYVTARSDEKGYSNNYYVEYETGDLSADYCIGLSKYNSEVAVGDVLDISINRYESDIYLSYDITDDNAVTISDYVSIYDFDVELKKRAEIIKGVINLPNDFNDDSIYIRAKSDDKWISDIIYLDDDEKTVEFVLAGDSENISDYNGEYELYITCSMYSGYEIYYNNGELSLDESTKVTVNDNTTNLELTIPEPNQYFEGTAILPESCSSDITVDVNVIEKSTSGYVGNRQFTIPAGDLYADFEIGYLLKNAEYIVSYSIYGENISPYYANMELFIAENGCSEVLEDAKTYVADGEMKTIDFDFEPLVCSSRIEGTITIPFGIVPASNTYFYVDVTAKSDDREENTSVRFNAGDAEKEYSISIPDLYRDSSWKLSYKIGTETDIPSAPAKEVLDDSSFKRPVPSAGGSGPIYNRVYNVIPAEVIKGVNVYYSADGITYDETEAEDVLVSDTEAYNADFVIGTTHTEHKRKVGGYFCAEDEDISVKIQLYDIIEGIVLDTVRLTANAEYKFYELETNTVNDVIIKYVYDDKEEYYSNNGELTELVGEAKTISVQSNPIQYGFDVNKDNIFYRNFNDRYFSYRIEGANYDYDDIEIKLYDIKGNILQSARGRLGDIDMDTAHVFIGFEFGGKTYYFAGNPNYSYRMPTLSFAVENIQDAYEYTIPHKSYSVGVIIDMSDFTSGRSIGNDGNAINESYFIYSKTEEGTNIESLYIDATDVMFEERKTIYLAFYSSTGQLLELKTIAEKPSDYIVPINYELPDGGYVKILGWESNLKPMVNTVNFFEGQNK